MKIVFLVLGWSLSMSSFVFGHQSIESSPFEGCTCSQTMDRQTASLLKQLYAEGVPSLDEATLLSLQKMAPPTSQKQLAQIKKIENIDIPGSIGPIKARLYFPHSNEKLPVFIFFHGGGWALGSLDEYDSICQELCKRSSCLIISVAYHLAPQHPFPKPLNDCYDATKWIAENIQDFGGDPTRLAIGGDSAGGNLAAAVTLMARDKGTPQIRYQILIYPPVNARLDTLSYFLFAEGYYLTRKNMQFFWENYLKQKTDGLNPYAAPLHAPSLAHLPPALVVIADFDPLRDEALAYAWRLHQHHVPVTIKRYPTIHGFINFEQELDVAQQAFEEIAHHLIQLKINDNFQHN